LVPVAIQSFVMQDLFAEQLKALRAASLDRHLREINSSQGPEIEIDGRRLVNFSSNDYLGLANDPRLREAAMAAIDEFGVGGTSRRSNPSTLRGDKENDEAPMTRIPSRTSFCHWDFVIPSSLDIRHLSFSQEPGQDRFQLSDGGLWPELAIGNQRCVQREMFRPIRLRRYSRDHVHNHSPRCLGVRH
jgi:hypothetical protein